MSNTQQTYGAMAAAAARVLQNYFEPEQGLYVDCVKRWWQSATALESIIDYMRLSGDSTYRDAIEAAFTNAQQSARGFINFYYDDEGWWAITWIKAFDLTGDERYLRMAESIFDDMAAGWDEGTCGGGLWWDKTPKYKAAIQNELFLVVAARLHQRSGGRGRYLDWARREWAWFENSGMINAGHLVNNGLDESCQNDGEPTWTYNQGVILGGLVELHRITGDGGLLDTARAIADAAITTLSRDGILQEPCEPSGECDGDKESFKGIFVLYLAYLREHLPADDYRVGSYARFLMTNADSVWANDRSSSDRFDLGWAGPFERTTVPTQTAALALFNAAMPFDPPQ